MLLFLIFFSVHYIFVQLDKIIKKKKKTPWKLDGMDHEERWKRMMQRKQWCLLNSSKIRRFKATTLIWMNVKSMDLMSKLMGVTFKNRWIRSMCANMKDRIAYHGIQLCTTKIHDFIHESTWHFEICMSEYSKFAPSFIQNCYVLVPGYLWVNYNYARIDFRICENAMKKTQSTWTELLSNVLFLWYLFLLKIC